MYSGYGELMMRWRNPTLEHHERQILKVSLFMLEEFMTDKTRDIKRRLRELNKYV